MFSVPVTQGPVGYLSIQLLIFSLFRDSREKPELSYYLVTGNNDDALKLSVYENNKIIYIYMYIYTHIYKYMYLIICIYNNIHVLSHSLNHTANETLSCLFLK